MKLEVASLSDVGKVRQKNEDAWGRFEPRDAKECAEKGFVFIVADGMGGHRGGEIASRLAVDTIISKYYEQDGDDSVVALRTSFDLANALIHERATDDQDLFGMGTTCTAMVVRPGEAVFGHVGDSRAYVLRNGNFQQLTEDHSLVGEMVRSGIISDEDAINHPKRNVITRSLGTQEELVTDFPSSPFKLSNDDVFLLCSDGLTGMVNDAQVKEVLSDFPPKEACRKLIELANENGGKDNVTVQVVKIHDKD